MPCIVVWRPSFVVKQPRNLAEITTKPAQPGPDPRRNRLLLATRYVLDLDTRELRTIDGHPIELRAKALDVLLLLAEQAGHVVDKSALMERAWPGVVVGDDSLTQTIVEIRRAIGDADRNVVSTVARRGYRLQAHPAPDAAAPAPAFSIAVLPISHEAGDADGMRLAAILSSELTARTGFDAIGSKVAARETVAAVGVRTSDPRVVAQELGVKQVVGGALQGTASGWKLALEIVDGASGARCWSSQFALDRAAPFAQIETVAAQAARAVLVQMHRAVAEQAASSPAADLGADELALSGWAIVYGGITPGNVERAKKAFEESLARHASELRALAGLCIMQWWGAMFDWVPDRRRAQESAVDIARRLEQSYPGETLTAVASCAAADIEGRWALRLAIADRLCQRNPAYATAHFLRSHSLLKLGRFDECLEGLAEARRLSVDDFRDGWWRGVEACAHLMAGRAPEAAAAAAQGVASNACMPLPALLLPAALAAAGGMGEAHAHLQAYLRRDAALTLVRAEWLLGDGEAVFCRERQHILDLLATLGMRKS
jgi:DNA-binding winged helix-turn-helix (wHTH) protein